MTTRPPVYLDFAASTPCDPRVLDAMLPFFTTTFGHPSCRHAYGAAAREAVERARGQAAALVGATPEEIIWTGGATEANNLAVQGSTRARARDRRGGHVVTSAIEHRSVLDPCRQLESEGFDVTFVAPGRAGVVTAELVERALRADTVLVSIIWVNNEIGTVSEIPQIGALCRARGIPFHADATQAVGLLPVNVDRDSIDLLSWSGHKIYGPKGVGALFVRRRDQPVALEPLVRGCGQEGGLRSGTHNVPGIVGLGAASEIARTEKAVLAPRLLALRRRLEDGLERKAGEIVVNGDRERRAPHISNVCFPALAGVPMIDELRDIACSAGSAGGTGARRPSHVLEALGVSRDLAATALRFSLGRHSTAEDIDFAVTTMASAVTRLARAPQPAS